MARKKVDPKAHVDPELEAKVAQVIATTPPPVPAPRPPPTKFWTRVQLEEQTRTIRSLYVSGYSAARDIHRAMRQMGHEGIGLKRVTKLLARVREQLAEKDSEEVAVARGAQLERLFEMRRLAEGEYDSQSKRWIRLPDHKAVIGYERLIAKLLGTEKEQKVDINVNYTAAMLNVTARLSTDEGTELLAEALEQARLADIARTSLPALTVPAGSVSSDAE